MILYFVNCYNEFLIISILFIIIYIHLMTCIENSISLSHCSFILFFFSNFDFARNISITILSLFDEFSISKHPMLFFWYAIIITVLG
jgi:hypothetical protein